MLTPQDLDELPRLPGPVLTAYLDVNPANPRNQRGRKGAATWLRSAARDLVAAWGPEERSQCLHQVARVSDAITGPPLRAKSVVVFSGPHVWRALPLQVGVDEEVYWGAPALGQMLWLFDEHQASGVVVVSRGGARFFRYRMGEIIEDPPQPMSVDTSQWRQRQLVHGLGTEQESFEQRKDAQYQRFFEEMAARCARWHRAERLEPVALLGSIEAIDAVFAALPTDVQGSFLRTDTLPARASESEIIRLAEPVMAEWRRQKESRDVQRLLEQRTSPEAVFGLDATLHALQLGQLRQILPAHNLRGRLWECRNCGWVDRSPQPECPNCHHREREPQSPRAVLPRLARARGVAVEIIAGEAEAQLRDAAEGLAGWRRAA